MSDEVFDFGGKFQSVSERIGGERVERLELGKRALSFGVKYLDAALGGILPNDLVLLGAKTGIGKTALASIIALHNVLAGKRVHYFALEAEPREIERRMKFQLLSTLYFQEAMRGQGERINYLDWHRGKLDDLLGPWEERAEDQLRKGLKNLHTYYRVKDFTSQDFERDLLAVQDQTDLAVLDHLHYVDSDDANENRGYKAIVKRVRDVALEVGRSVIVVAHVRKGDRRYESLVPGIEDFHGTSDVPKMATKAIMLAAAYDQPSTAPFIWPTYMQVAKCRTDNSRTRYVASVDFNSRCNRYADQFTLGRLVDGGKKFEQVNNSDLPYWARHS